ncbi:MAG: hypothetical protein HZA77_07735 [Candidatus Schekmanbacteria bacterium]|nr:hypothetical protein [Candidatus Schekmanbacteria bacterium]
MNNYKEFITMLSSEFNRYLMENEKLAKKIPVNAMIIFQVDGEEEFNKWHKDVSLKNKESGQPVIFLNVKKWRTHSSIEELSMANP